MRKRTSNIWTYPSDKFKSLVLKSESYTEILRFFGKENKGGNFRTLKARIAEENISTCHIDSTRKERFFNNQARAIPLKEVMVRDSGYSRGALKARLLKEGILINKCSLCDLKAVWHGLPLVFVLDHINGESRDHRRSNLRLLCPNCNSQQTTFAGRKNKIDKRCKCGTKIHRQYEQCECCSRLARRKVKRPEKKVLLLEIAELGYCGTGRKYGISDKAIRKWVKAYS